MNSMHIQSVFAAIFGISTRITVEEDDGEVYVTFELNGHPMHYSSIISSEYDFLPDGDNPAPYDFASICFPVLKETK